MRRGEFHTEGVFFLCGVDWQHELGSAIDGTTLYPNLEWLKKFRPCVKGCGIVQVKVSFDLEAWPEKQKLEGNALNLQECYEADVPLMKDDAQAKEMIAGVLDTINKLCSIDPKYHTPEGRLLQGLAIHVEAYEKKRWPIGKEKKL